MNTVSHRIFGTDGVRGRANEDPYKHLHEIRA